MADFVQPLSPNKSTNVRAGSQWPIAIARAVLPWLSETAPAAAGLVADWMFFTPWRTSRHTDWPEGGTPITASVDGVTVRGSTWGDGPPVFLVHGWAGTGAQMGAFVAPLVDRGFRVVAWDAPGHGSSGGWRSSMVTFARVIDAMAGRFGAPPAIVAHSLGGAAAVFAARRGLRVERLCLVGSPAHPVSWAETFAADFGLGDRAIARMKRRVEDRLRVGWDELEVPELARGLAQRFLLVHDAGDREVPPADSEEIAAVLEDVQVLRTAGLGHRRILRDPEVVQAVVEFVGRPRSAWSTAALERELFDRDLRAARA